MSPRLYLVNLKVGQNYTNETICKENLEGTKQNEIELNKNKRFKTAKRIESERDSQLNQGALIGKLKFLRDSNSKLYQLYFLPLDWKALCEPEHEISSTLSFLNQNYRLKWTGFNIIELYETILKEKLVVFTKFQLLSNFKIDLKGDPPLLVTNMRPYTIEIIKLLRALEFGKTGDIYFLNREDLIESESIINYKPLIENKEIELVMKGLELSRKKTVLGQVVQFTQIIPRINKENQRVYTLLIKIKTYNKNESKLVEFSSKEVSQILLKCSLLKMDRYYLFGYDNIKRVMYDNDTREVMKMHLDSCFLSEIYPINRKKNTFQIFYVISHKFRIYLIHNISLEKVSSPKYALFIQRNSPLNILYDSGDLIYFSTCQIVPYIISPSLRRYFGDEFNEQLLNEDSIQIFLDGDFELFQLNPDSYFKISKLQYLEQMDFQVMDTQFNDGVSSILFYLQILICLMDFFKFNYFDLKYFSNILPECIKSTSIQNNGILNQLIKLERKHLTSHKIIDDSNKIFQIIQSHNAKLQPPIPIANMLIKDNNSYNTFWIGKFILKLKPYYQWYFAPLRDSYQDDLIPIFFNDIKYPEQILTQFVNDSNIFNNIWLLSLDDAVLLSNDISFSIIINLNRSFKIPVNYDFEGFDKYRLIPIEIKWNELEDKIETKVCDEYGNEYQINIPSYYQLNSQLIPYHPIELLTLDKIKNKDVIELNQKMFINSCLDVNDINLDANVLLISEYEKSLPKSKVNICGILIGLYHFKELNITELILKDLYLDCSIKIQLDFIWNPSCIFPNIYLTIYNLIFDMKKEVLKLLNELKYNLFIGLPLNQEYKINTTWISYLGNAFKDIGSNIHDKLTFEESTLQANYLWNINIEKKHISDMHVQSLNQAIFINPNPSNACLLKARIYQITYLKVNFITENRLKFELQFSIFDDSNPPITASADSLKTIHKILKMPIASLYTYYKAWFRYLIKFNIKEVNLLHSSSVIDNTIIDEYLKKIQKSKLIYSPLNLRLATSIINGNAYIWDILN